MKHPGVDRDEREGASKPGGAWLTGAVSAMGVGLAWMWLGEYLGLDELGIGVQTAIVFAAGMVGWLIDRERKSRIVDAGQDPPMTAQGVRKRLDESGGLIDRVRRAIRLSEAGDD